MARHNRGGKALLQTGEAAQTKGSESRVEESRSLTKIFLKGPEYCRDAGFHAARPHSFRSR
jgi:hypothetical protein